MKLKLIVKVGFLTICLIIAIGLMKVVSSGSFRTNLNEIFTSNTQVMKWCPDHVVDFKWLMALSSAKDATRLASLKPSQFKNEFCQISMDSIETAMTNGKFEALLEASSATAKTVLLEWDPNHNLFRVQGIVFRSAPLNAKLNGL